MMPWKKMSAANVRGSTVDHSYVQNNIDSLVTKRETMVDASVALKRRWGDMADSYATRHTLDAIQRMDPLVAGVEVAAAGFDQTISALKQLIADLEAVAADRRELTADIVDFVRETVTHGPTWLNYPTLSWRNKSLWDKRDTLSQRETEALQKCAEALSKIRMEANGHDPNFGITERDGTSLHQGRLDVPLFGFTDEIRGDQVRQGALGDCWLQASMASLADADPDFIRDMITDNHDGTYTVKLYDIQGERHNVVVDGDFLLDDYGAPYYAGAGGGATALWPLLIEKAVAQDRGSYSAIESAYGDDGIRLLMGKGSMFKSEIIHDVHAEAGIGGWLSNGGDKDISDQRMLQMVHDEHYVAVASTQGGPVEIELEGGGGGVVEIAENHVYQLADVQRDSDGEYWVTVVNPWNGDTKLEDGDSDVIVLSMDQFRGLFREVHYAPTQ